MSKGGGPTVHQRKSFYHLHIKINLKYVPLGFDPNGIDIKYQKI